MMPGGVTDPPEAPDCPLPWLRLSRAVSQGPNCPSAPQDSSGGALPSLQRGIHSHAPSDHPVGAGGHSHRAGRECHLAPAGPSRHLHPGRNVTLEKTDLDGRVCELQGRAGWSGQAGMWKRRGSQGEGGRGRHLGGERSLGRGGEKAAGRGATFLASAVLSVRTSYDIPRVLRIAGCTVSSGVYPPQPKDPDWITPRVPAPRWGVRPGPPLCSSPPLLLAGRRPCAPSY